jgi:adenylate cyclase
MNKRISVHRQPLLISLLTMLVVLAAWGLGIFQVLELKAIDLAFNWRGIVKPSTPAIIVAIDNESLSETNLPYPWPRAYFARLIEVLIQGKPKIIVLDVPFYEAAEGDATLAETLRRAGNVILVSSLTVVRDPSFQMVQLNRPLETLARNAAASGLSNFPRDRDGFVRYVPAHQEYDSTRYYHWALTAAALYASAPLNSPASDQVMLGNRTIPLQDGLLAINYSGPVRTFRHIPAYQIVNGEIAPERFKDAIVLVGATTDQLSSTFPIPFRGDILPMSEVEIGANAIETILTGAFLTCLGSTATLIVLLAIGLIGVALNALRQPLVGLAMLGGLILAYAAVWLAAFNFSRIILPLVAPVSMLVMAYGTRTAVRAAAETAAQQQVRHLFEQFISPQVVRELVDSRQEASSGKRAELTFLFADIRNFTAISEKLAPERLVGILNSYLQAMTEVIFRYRGTVDKYEGDAIVAFWGAPFPDSHHPANAVRAAIAMRQTLMQLRDQWVDRIFCQLEIGIGINTGEAFVGFVGSEKRFNYTVIGDQVNLAARLQELTKEYDCPLLISESTCECIRDQFDVEFVASRIVKGKSTPVRIYQVVREKSAPAYNSITPSDLQSQENSS